MHVDLRTTTRMYGHKVRFYPKKTSESLFVSKTIPEGFINDKISTGQLPAVLNFLSLPINTRRIPSFGTCHN